MYNRPFLQFGGHIFYCSNNCLLHTEPVIYAKYNNYKHVVVANRRPTKCRPCHGDIWTACCVIRP